MSQPVSGLFSSGDAGSLQAGNREGMNVDIDARIEEIEAKLSLAEDLLDQLNQVVFRQQAQIDSLQQQLRLVWQQVQSGSAVAADVHDPRAEIPPHY